MDASGVEIMIASLNAPAVQAIHDVKRAVAVAREANDHLAAEIAQAPGSLPGFAALPMQDPDEAARELTRCVKELGFVGALVNGFSQAGDAEQRALLRPAAIPAVLARGRAARCAVLPAPAQSAARLRSRPTRGTTGCSGPNWAFHAETAVHALRLIGSGLFDEFPTLQIILGHLGEGIPAYLWRIDHRNDWMKAPHKYAAKKWRRAITSATTSCSRPRATSRPPRSIRPIAEIGIERVLWSADYPFEDISDAADWIDAAPLSDGRQGARSGAPMR